MPEKSPVENQRLLTTKQIGILWRDTLDSAIAERPETTNNNLANVKAFISNGIHMIQRFEQATYQRHPKIHSDTDVIYIDSGPGPYSYKMLEQDKTDLDDTNYHKWPWSRKMDRARIRTAYVLAAMITAKRIEEQTGTQKPILELTVEDFEKYGPYLMYTSVDWQASHIRRALQFTKGKGLFKIPDDKLIMYERFVNRQGEESSIAHTEDQIEGLNFPKNPDGTSPRRIVIVSHPAHLMRVMHILGKFPDSIPAQTTLQAFPIPTPSDATTEYAKTELLGTLFTALVKNKATLEPYNRYEL